jgi:tetratricopeptide (TPR) repeat protein
MKLTDLRGLPVSAQNSWALELYELAARQTQGYFGNPLATLDEALAEEPDFAMAHALRADLAVMSSEQGALPLIQSSIDALARMGGRAHRREQAHVAAAAAWMEGRFERAAALYGAIVVDYPRDLLALQTAHVIDFFLGDSIMLRDRPAQVLPHWNPEVPGFGCLLGMYAFGLEETANYARAEDVGRRALDLNPHDPWGVHAVLHVFEMQGRVYDGMQWLQATSPNWKDTAISYHLWWHLALLHLELDDITSALDVYDRLVHPRATEVALELVDASQLLSRISLRGGDVGDRWQSLAEGWAAHDEGGFYAFNDVHALIAYTAAGRDEHQRRMLAKLEKSADGVHTNAIITRELGLPLARAIVAMACGRHAEAVELLLPVRSRMNRIGGSHAQRDLVQLTCHEAALRCGNGRLARALASERTEQKPTSPFNWELMARALDVTGNAAAAKPVREHAELRRRAQLRRKAA